MRINIIFLLVFLPLTCVSQSSRGPNGLWVGFSGGTELVNNSNLNHWLINNGVKASSSFDFSYGVKALGWQKKLVFCGELGGSTVSSPKQKNTYLNFLVGLPLRSGRFNIIPLTGVGGVTIVQKFNDSIPEILYQTKITNGELFKNRFSIETQVMFFLKVGKFDSFGVTVGCHTYLIEGNWKYVGDNGKAIENSIPNPSIFSPFISVQYGFTTWNINRKN